MSPNDRNPLSTGIHSGLVLLMAAMTTSPTQLGQKIIIFCFDWFSAWPVVDTRIFVNAQQTAI